MTKRFKKKLIKISIYALTFTLIATSFIVKNNVSAASYVYDYWKNVIPSTEGITYKETYYYKDILSADTGNADLVAFNTLTDMEVYDGKIYLLDRNTSGATEVPLATTAVDPATGMYPTYAGISYIVVINQNFQYEKIVNEFLITDYVKKKLDDFYRFTVPLNEITPDQFTSTEFVDSYEHKTTDITIKDGKAELDSSFTERAIDTLEIVISDEIIDKTKYQVLAEGGKYIVKFNDGSYDGKAKANFEHLSAPAKAPYIPYSKDFTKAAVRLDNAQGITVDKDGIFIADTNNARILKLNFDYEVVDVYLTPNDSTFYQIYNSGTDGEYETTKTTSGEVFHPEKVAHGADGSLYCIATNIYEGLIEYNSTTTFNRFMGKNKVQADPFKKFLKKVFTEEQITSLALDLPPMFTNISMSPDGALYSTSKPNDSETQAVNMVKIINKKGNDILKRNGYTTPDGDVVYIATTTDEGVVTGSSVFTAVAAAKNGNFTVVDQTRGRLFTYDAEGNLLYITGDQPGGTLTQGSGNGLSNSIINPVAVDYLYRNNEQGEEEETVIVLDQFSKSIILFETTEFGNLVNQATTLYQNGVIEDVYEVDADGNFKLDENGNKILVSEGAESYWRKVIKMNTNYELAYLGIGKALNRRGEYKEAMHYFELAHNGEYYSKAFSSYRDGVLSENFALIMAVIILFVIALIVKQILKTYQKRNLHFTGEGE